MRFWIYANGTRAFLRVYGFNYFKAVRIFLFYNRYCSVAVRTVSAVRGRLKSNSVATIAYGQIGNYFSVSGVDHDATEARGQDAGPGAPGAEGSGWGASRGGA